MEKFDMSTCIAGFGVQSISPEDNTIDLTGRGICIQCQQRVADALMKKAKPADPLQEATSKIMRDRNEIIDLFCKTFLVVQEAPDLEALKALFDLVELECTMGKDLLSQTFRIKLRETPKP